MSSPCTVDTICLPFDATLPHARTHEPSRQLETAESRRWHFLPILCGVTRAVQAVLFATARTCVHHRPGNPRAAMQLILSFVPERRSTPSARQQVPRLFLHVYPWRPSDSTTFSASNGGIDAYNSGSGVRFFFLPDPPRAHDGLPWLSLSVSAHPVLLGASSRLTKARLYRDSRVHLCGDQCTLPSRLTLAHSSGSSHPPLLPSQCHPSHTLISSCSSWCMSFLHFILHATCSFVFMYNSAYHLCILCFLILSPRLQLLLVLSQLFLHRSDNLMYPMFLFVPSSRL